MEESLFGPLLVNIDFFNDACRASYITHINQNNTEMQAPGVAIVLLLPQYYYYENWCMGLF